MLSPPTFFIPRLFAKIFQVFFLFCIGFGQFNNSFLKTIKLQELFWLDKNRKLIFKPGNHLEDKHSKGKIFIFLVLFLSEQICKTISTSKYSFYFTMKTAYLTLLPKAYHPNHQKQYIFKGNR